MEGCGRELFGYSYNYKCGQISVELKKVYCKDCKEKDANCEGDENENK